jgi:hypothetical protein
MANRLDDTAAGHDSDGAESTGTVDSNPSHHPSLWSNSPDTLPDVLQTPAPTVAELGTGGAEVHRAQLDLASVLQKLQTEMERVLDAIYKADNLVNRSAVHRNERRDLRDRLHVTPRAEQGLVKINDRLRAEEERKFRQSAREKIDEAPFGQLTQALEVARKSSTELVELTGRLLNPDLPDHDPDSLVHTARARVFESQKLVRDRIRFTAALIDAAVKGLPLLNGPSADFAETRSFSYFSAHRADDLAGQALDFQSRATVRPASAPAPSPTTAQTLTTGNPDDRAESRGSQAESPSSASPTTAVQAAVARLSIRPPGVTATGTETTGAAVVPAGRPPRQRSPSPAR